MTLFLDVIGLIFIATGLTLVWLGHHYFGPLWFWLGVTMLAPGVYVLGRNFTRQRKIEEALLSHRGPGDYGDTHCHSGADHADADGGD